MRQLLISDESRLDILDAFSWYERRRAGLGKDFVLCLESGLDQIQRDPALFQKRYKIYEFILLTDFLTASIIWSRKML